MPEPARSYGTPIAAIPSSTSGRDSSKRLVKTMHRGQPATRAPGIDSIERAAIGATTLCLIHCAGLPLLLAALPVLSSLIHVPESFHIWILALAVPSAALALSSGRRRHRRAYPLLAGLAGLFLLAAGALLLLGGPWETPVTILGSLCLAFAHVANWRLRHRHHQCA